MYPKVIYFCTKEITELESKMANNWKILNPDYEIKLYDDNMCKQFLLENYGQLYCDIFDYLRDGPIKADFWRICILYKFGGIYCDIDNEPLLPLCEWIEPDIDFVTCSSYWESMGFNFNPNFIISYKNNPILKKCIDWYINKFNNNTCYTYWGLSIMRTFTECLIIDGFIREPNVYNYEGMKIQIIQECSGKNHHDAHNIYGGKRVFNDRYKNYDAGSHKFLC